MTHLDHKTDAFKMHGFAFNIRLLKDTNVTASNNHCGVGEGGEADSRHNPSPSDDKLLSEASPSVTSILLLQHVELDESPGKHGERPDDAHGHEHTEQDVVQNHGDELPLLRRVVGLLV